MSSTTIFQKWKEQTCPGTSVGRAMSSLGTGLTSTTSRAGTSSGSWSAVGQGFLRHVSPSGLQGTQGQESRSTAVGVRHGCLGTVRLVAHNRQAAVGLTALATPHTHRLMAALWRATCAGASPTSSRLDLYPPCTFTPRANQPKQVSISLLPTPRKPTGPLQNPSQSSLGQGLPSSENLVGTLDRSTWNAHIN